MSLPNRPQARNRDCVERTAFLNSPIDLSKTTNLLHEQIARTFGEDDCEKENAALDFWLDGIEA